MSGAAMTRSPPGLWLCSTESLALAGGGGVRGPGVRQSSGESLCPHHGQGEAREPTFYWPGVGRAGSVILPEGGQRTAGAM